MLLLEHTPAFSIQAATAWAGKLYGLSATAIRLPSERDQNFFAETAAGEKSVFKIANALEIAPCLKRSMTRWPNLSHLSLCPRVLPSLAGETICLIESPMGQNTSRDCSAIYRAFRWQTPNNIRRNCCAISGGGWASWTRRWRALIMRQFIAIFTGISPGVTRHP